MSLPGSRLLCWPAWIMWTSGLSSSCSWWAPVQTAGYYRKFPLPFLSSLLPLRWTGINKNKHSTFTSAVFTEDNVSTPSNLNATVWLLFVVFPHFLPFVSSCQFLHSPPCCRLLLLAWRDCRLSCAFINTHWVTKLYFSHRLLLLPGNFSLRLYKRFWPILMF